MGAPVIKPKEIKMEPEQNKLGKRQTNTKLAPT